MEKITNDEYQLREELKRELKEARKRVLEALWKA